MTQPTWWWRQRDRDAFLVALAETGDPAAAARAVDRPMEQAWRQRDVCPAFAAGWARAIAIAWERAETQVLAALLKLGEPEAPEAPATTEGATAAGKPRGGGRSTLLDSRLALALVQRREAGVKRVHGKPVEGSAVTRLRAEIRALTTERTSH